MNWIWTEFRNAFQQFGDICVIYQKEKTTCTHTCNEKQEQTIRLLWIFFSLKMEHRLLCENQDIVITNNSCYTSVMLTIDIVQYYFISIAWKCL